MLKTTLIIQAETRKDLVWLLQTAISQIKEVEDLDIISYNRPGNGNNSIDGNIIDNNEQRERFEKEAGYKLSENQLQFCQDAENEDLELDFTYSGRGMFGKTCPSVDLIEGDDELHTTTKTRRDSMGKGIVIYAEH